MRFFTRTSGGGSRGHRRTSVRRGLTAALWLGLFAAAPAAAQGAPDTVRVVENRATARFRASGESIESTTAASARVTVRYTAGIRLAPPRAAAAFPGERRVFAHVLENTGTGADAFVLQATGPAGWALSVYLDLDGDGALGAADRPVPGPLPLERGASAALLLVVDVPADAADAPNAGIDLRATSVMDPAVAASVRDTVSVRRPLAAVSMGKTVDRSTATPGDTLLYTLTWANRGDAATPPAVLADSLPAGVRFVAGSLRLGGSPLTDAADGDAGEIERGAAGGEVVRVRVGVLTPGAAGVATFRVVVAADASGAIDNLAVMAWESGAGGSIRVSTPAARTQLVSPTMTVGKELLAAAPARLGEEVRYRLSWSNASDAVSVRDAVLADTLPAGLQFVSADGSPEVDGQVVRWRLGTLAPKQTGSLTLVTRAMSRPESGHVVNRATARGANAAPVSAEAAAAEILGFQGDELEIAKSAGVLEAGLGDAIPYAVTLRNKGLAPIRNIVMRDSLPEGVRYLADRLHGADSARANGREVTIWVAGPLAPGAEHVVRYAVTVVSTGRGRALANRVSAQAEDGRVRTSTATAFVRVRGGFAMQARTVVGKVWVDVDGDGRQDAGEPGAPGVDVWSADGEVVTTDAHGRFSFRDLRSGTHALRLDTLGLPSGARLERAGDGIVRVRLDGWTTPRADFRLVPRAGFLVSADSATIRATVFGSPSTAVSVDPAKVATSIDPPTPATSADPNAAALSNSSNSSNPTTSATPVVPAAAVRGGGMAPGAGDLATNAVTADTTAALAVAPLRTAKEREEEDGRTFAEGPTVRIAAPVDGAVVASNRLYVGVRGEPGAQVKLFDGERQVAEGQLRPDGKMDFVGVELAPGAHRLRVSMTSSWGRERWDSAAVHRSGEAARFEVPAGPVTLRAESRALETVRVRVLDEWGVPLAGGATVTFEAKGATGEGSDADPSSVGAQARVGADGYVEIALRPGHDVGPGELRLTSGEATGRVALRVLPSTRPLIATGTGQVGVGASDEAFGAVTVRGSVGRETTVSASWDSRRSDEDQDFFGRGYDPLDEGRYPTLGDASERRVLSGATQTFSARVERGFDWLELGDVTTADFGGDARLGSYQRSLTGVSGRMTTGVLTWRGFGSLTDQVFSQRQLRGDGTSGPYRFGGPVRPGTERVAVEVRDRENAARVIARQELVRFNDYQVDYATGEVLLTRPVPATDGAGNPVFVVAALERRSGGEARFVGGLKVELDAARALRIQGFDSLAVSAMGVRDEDEGTNGIAGHDLWGGGLRLRRGALAFDGELLRSERPDSSALAGRAGLRWSFLPDDRGQIQAEWLKVGAGFAPGTDPRLSAGVEELRVGADLRVTDRSRLHLGHERQRFDGYDVERQTTTARAEQNVAGHAVTAEGGVSTDAQGGASSTSAVARVTMAVTQRLDVWLEGTQALSQSAPEGSPPPPARPDQVGAGASLRLPLGVRLDAAHRRVRADSAAYEMSSVNLSLPSLFGAQMHGGLERTGSAGERAVHSAVLGWSQRVAIAGGWSVNGLYERRFGLSQASLLDPARALPFAQAERNRWSVGAGLEWLPGDSTPRLSLRREMHRGEESRGHRFDVAGEAPLGPSAALITRHDWWSETRSGLGGLGTRETLRRDRSVFGLALRPVNSDAFNVLAKLEWRHTVNPLGGGVLAGGADDRRLIGAADAVWAARPGTELAARYAVRWASLADTAAGTPALESFAHFLGARGQQYLDGPFSLRLDGRLLLDTEGGARRWNLAPALLADLGGGIELEGGYRFGDLLDADFSAQGGNGFYATLGIRFTEGLAGDAASFWRERILRDR